MTRSATGELGTGTTAWGDVGADVRHSDRPDAGNWIMLGMLSVAFLISAVDRQVLALLVEPIKADLHLSDGEIGALQGFAFLLIYATAAIPAGLLVDRINRTRLIAGAMTLWSLMTAACGLATSFPALFVARAGVGVGEAALTPAGYSLIGDRFPTRLHARVFGLYHTGSALGAGLAYVIGGHLFVALSDIGNVDLPFWGPVAPWQMTFVLLMIPGLIVAALFLLLRDPRVVTRNERERGLLSPQLRHFVQRHWRMLVLHHAAVGFCYVAMSGSAAWTAAYFVRIHGLSLDQIGVWLGTAAALGGVIGLLGGGAVSDFLFRFGAHVRLTFCMAVCLAGSLASIAFVLMDSPLLCAFFFMIQVICSAIPVSTGNAALQYLAPSGSRGTISAIYFFAISLIGSPGATLIGLANDRLFPAADGIRASMVMVIPVTYLLSAILFFFGTRAYKNSCRLAAEDT